MGAHGSPERWGHSDRKSTRLNSSHSQISYAVFCLKKKRTRPRRGHSISLVGRGQGTEDLPWSDRRRAPPRHHRVRDIFFIERAPPEIYPLSPPAAFPI